MGLAAAQNLAADFHGRGLPETLSSAEALARRAVALDGADAEARSWLGHALRRRGDYEGGRAEAERAVAISPNLAVANRVLGQVLVFSGHPKEGVAALRACVRLDPRAPTLGSCLNQIALGLYFCGEYVATVEGRTRRSGRTPVFRTLIVGLPPRSANSAGWKRRRTRWKRRSRSRPPRLTCMSATGCHGCSQKITRTCSKACVRPDGRASRLSEPAVEAYADRSNVSATNALTLLPVRAAAVAIRRCSSGVIRTVKLPE